MFEKKEKESKISKEVAEKEFYNYCDANCIDYDESAMDEDDAKNFSKAKKKFIAACMEGRVIVDGRKLTYIVSELSENQKGDKIEIMPLKGKGMIAVSGSMGKNSNPIMQLYALLSSVTGKDVSYFGELSYKDLKFFDGIAMLFLAE